MRYTSLSFHHIFEERNDWANDLNKEGVLLDLGILMNWEEVGDIASYYFCQSFSYDLWAY